MIRTEPLQATEAQVFDWHRPLLFSIAYSDDLPDSVLTLDSNGGRIQAIRNPDKLCAVSRLSEIERGAMARVTEATRQSRPKEKRTCTRG